MKMFGVVLYGFVVFLLFHHHLEIVYQYILPQMHQFSYNFLFAPQKLRAQATSLLIENTKKSEILFEMFLVFLVFVFE